MGGGLAGEERSWKAATRGGGAERIRNTAHSVRQGADSVSTGLRRRVGEVN